MVWMWRAMRAASKMSASVVEAGIRVRCAGDGDGQRPLVVAGNVDQDLVGRVMAGGFLQVLGEQLGIGRGDGNARGPCPVVGEPARDGAVVVEIDDMDALAGPGVGAGECHAACGFADPSLGGGEGDDQGAPQSAQNNKCANAYLSVHSGLSRTIRAPATAASLENGPDAIAAASRQFAHRRGQLAQHGLHGLLADAKGACGHGGRDQRVGKKERHKAREP